MLPQVVLPSLPPSSITAPAPSHAPPPPYLAGLRVLLQRKVGVADAEVRQRVGHLHPHRRLERVQRLAVPASGRAGGRGGGRAQARRQVGGRAGRQQSPPMKSGSIVAAPPHESNHLLPPHHLSTHRATPPHPRTHRCLAPSLNPISMCAWCAAHSGIAAASRCSSTMSASAVAAPSAAAVAAAIKVRAEGRQPVTEQSSTAHGKASPHPLSITCSLAHPHPTPTSGAPHDALKLLHH